MKEEDPQIPKHVTQVEQSLNSSLVYENLDHQQIERGEEDELVFHGVSVLFCSITFRTLFCSEFCSSSDSPWKDCNLSVPPPHSLYFLATSWYIQYRSKNWNQIRILSLPLFPTFRSLLRQSFTWSVNCNCL